MEWYEPENAYNIVRSWNMAQGMTHATDDVNRIQRDINVRHILISNSSRDQAVGVGIESHMCGPPAAKIRFVLEPGRSLDVGINSHGGPAQFIHILNPQTGKPIGPPTVLSTNANEFVLREGLNEWFVTKFKKSSVNRAN